MTIKSRLKGFQIGDQVQINEEGFRSLNKYDRGKIIDIHKLKESGGDIIYYKSGLTPRIESLNEYWLEHYDPKISNKETYLETPKTIEETLKEIEGKLRST